MVSPAIIKRLTKELVQLQQNPPDGIRVAINEADVLSFSAWIQGPPETPYQDGYFQIQFDFQGVDFPTSPPTCTFVTKIFHPNVSRIGEICVSTLKKDWNPEYGIARILVTIKCLLIAPNPDSALDPEASRLLQETYQDYFETAKMWTCIHACKKPSLLFDSLTTTTTTTEKITTTTTTTPCLVKKSIIPSVAPKRGVRRL